MNATLIDLIIPQGVIVAWHANTTDKVPSGWAICDGHTEGTFKTPDLRGRILRGVGSVAEQDKYRGALSNDTTTVNIVKHRDQRTGDGFQGEGDQCMNGTVDIPLPLYYTVVYIIKL